MSTKSYRVRVHDLGTTAPSDATVDYTLTTQIAEAPTIPGQTVDPIRGRTQSRPWAVTVVDASGVITSRLADAGGRMQQLGRIVELQESVDSGSYATIATGRLSDLNEMAGAGLWELKVEDERWVERNATIFTVADTTQIYPSGLRFRYRGYGLASTLAMTVVKVRGNMVLLKRDASDSDPERMPSAIQDLIWDDLKDDWTSSTAATSGNFTTLRAAVSGTDREVGGFNYFGSGDGGYQFVAPRLDLLDSEDPVPYLWVLWPTSQPSVGAHHTVALHMPLHEPTDTLPLHLGVASASHDYGTAEGGIQPFDLVKRLYDDTGVRYNSTALTALMSDGRYPRIFHRITSAQNLATYLEDYIYGPLSVVPFINASGEVQPKAVHLPEDIDPDTLTTLDASNQAEQPTFLHSRREVANALRFEYTSESYITADQIAGGNGGPADRIRVSKREFSRDFDNQDNLGRHEITYHLDGYQTRTGTDYFLLEPQWGIDRNTVADYLSREVFDRFGDGPISGRIVGLSDVADVEAGDLVVMALSTYPNPTDNDRGGERILQILCKDITPAGPEFDYLDIGPASQPLAGPTIAIAKNAAVPEFDVDVTISDVPTGATAQIQLAYGASEPAYTSDLWFPGASDVGNETVTLTGNPTGQVVWARARTTAPGRIRSAWSDPVSVTLDATPRVRDVAISVDAGVPTVTWEANTATAGVRVYYEVHLDTVTPTLTDSADADSDDGTLTLDATVRAGESITVEVEPYTGWDGGAVSGTAGARVRVTLVQSVNVSSYSLIDFREVEASAAGRRRWGWTARGAKVDSVWYAAQAFTTPFDVADAWATVAGLVLPLPSGQDYVEIDVPAGDENVLLQVEPRLADLTVHDADVVERVQLYPVPTTLDITLSATIVSNLVDLSLKLEAGAGARPYSATALVYEGDATGTLLASFTFTADGTKTKADDSDLGGRSLPAEGKKVWTVVVTDRTGTVRSEQVTVNAPRLPYFDGVRSVLSADLLSVDIFGTVTDPAGLGGTLEYWLPADESTATDPSGTATGSVVIAAASMPYAMGPSGITDFNDVVTVGNAFSLVLKFTASDGRTTGKQAFPLAGSMQFLVDELGKLRAESVHNQLVLANDLRTWSYVADFATLSALTPATFGNTQAYTYNPTTHVGVRYVWNAGTSVWDADTTTPVVASFPIFEAGIVKAEVLAADAAKLTLVGANRVVADNVNIGSLELISDDAGAIVNGSFVNAAGTAGLDLDATGTDRVFWAGGTAGNEKIKVLASGALTISGYAESGDLAGLSAIIRATSAPATRSDGTALVSGDQWIDTDDGNAPYSWSGSAWVRAYTNIDGGSITTGIITANRVQIGSGTTFDTGYNPTGKVTTFAQTSAPTAIATGDLWIDTDDSNKLYRWSGSAWVAYRDGTIPSITGLSAILYATTAPTTRSGGSALVQGDQWIDTDDGNKPYIWSGAAWTEAYTSIDGGSIKTGSIQSTIYTAGSAGWNIDFDGSAEFNDVTIRGTLDGVDGTFSGDLSAVVTEIAGTLFLAAKAQPPADTGLPTSEAAVIQWGGDTGITGGARFVFDNSGGSVRLYLQMRNTLGGDWTTKFTFNFDGTIT